LPGTDSPSQKRKLRVPGSPIGQQQVMTRPYGRGGGDAGGCATRGNGAGRGAMITGGRGGNGAAGCAGASPALPSAMLLTAVLDSGGRDGPVNRRGGPGREGGRSPSRRIGEGRAGRSSRCALPTTAFFDTPSRRPISAVE
jgi:hypothetical protein